MNDIIPPKKRPLGSVRPPIAPVTAPMPPQSAPSALPAISLAETQSSLKTPKKGKKKLILWLLGGFIALLAVAALAMFVWYTSALQPVSNDTTKARIHIASGSSPGEIAQLLETKKLIRNAFVFDIYTRLSGTRSELRAGTYNLSPSESTEAIVGHLVSGNVDQFNVTFLPGATLAQNRLVLIKAGYSETEVDAALLKTYEHPLFQDKPSKADLEGYIYGETYNFDSNATVEQILEKTFDQYYSVIKDNNLIDGFAKQGLNLYQGITLASVIQREVSGAADQKQVAQVFLKRLSIDMPLGSDVTYQYAAKILGVSPTPDLDSPYNTRKYTGLPPGPIATPGVGALQAVAAPASGDYLYFLSGDDNVTYFATTNDEHEMNVRDHCQKKCSIL
ncbi:MAG TPA: endolytic transglycosylase MltG [Candidatus Saccharimonadales bacterium]|nr:endolytic transglycosylase MltG [Candidatus Saccharimonadales bacterium]